jgi:hypothetical protein
VPVGAAVAPATPGPAAAKSVETSVETSVEVSRVAVNALDRRCRRIIFLPRVRRGDEIGAPTV